MQHDCIVQEKIQATKSIPRLVEQTGNFAGSGNLG
jgi:hypothetical protein